ncbi:MAG: aminopeptidase [Smithellaceae bacterium]|nr:aminopeptidase [Smithellaceae bacterium]
MGDMRKRKCNRLFGWRLSISLLIVVLSVTGLVSCESISHKYGMYKAMQLLDPTTYSEEQRIDGARVMVKSCMNVKSGEKVLLIVQNDEKRKILGKYMEAEVRRLGAIPTIVMVEPSEMMSEPPKQAYDEMMKNDVILAALGLNQIQVFAHTKARNVATDEKKARLGLVNTFIPGVTNEDIMKIRERTEKVARIMEDGSVAHITGPGGTDLTFSVKGRRCERLRASMWEPGEWGAIPLYAEAALAPIEGTANGQYLVNGFFEYVGLVTDPFLLIIKDGRVVEVRGSGSEAQKVRDIIAAADANGTNIAELGVATNHIKMFEGFSGTIVDKMILGTIHIAIGKNTTFEGGTVYSNIHHDAVSGGMTLVIDNTTVIKDGKFMLD